MAIYQRATGWQIKVQRDGHRFVDFVLGLDCYQQAKEIETQAIADMTRGLRPVGGQLKHGTSLTLQAAYDYEMVHTWSKESKGYVDKVEQYYKDFVRYFVDQQGIKTLDRIDTKAIDGFIQWCETKARPNKPKTINNKLTVLHTILKRQTEHGHLKGMPVVHWKKLGKSNERFRYYSPWEENQILLLTQDMWFHDSSLNDLLCDFLIILFDTGMRPWREAHNMQASWLTYDQLGSHVIRIPREFSKTGRSRDIPVQDRALVILQERLQGQDGSFQPFKKLDYKWHCMKFWNDLVRPTMRWGKDEVFYCMRHTFATRLVEYDVNLKVIQELMGHSNISQTAKYAKCTDNAKLAGITKLNAGRLGLTNVTQMGDTSVDIIPARQVTGTQSQAATA